MIVPTFVLSVATVLAVQGSPDSAASRLLSLARARRQTIDRSISAYQVTMRERIGAGVRALRRDRVLYRRELVLRIDWRRDGVGRIDVVGARQVIPAARADAELPDDLKGDVADYAFDPADDRMAISLGGGGSSDEEHAGERRRQVIRHPLAPGSEADYRFATGDSSVLTFQGGRTIRLRELRVTPRRLEFRLVAGSLWIDEASGAVVRALFRPARPWDFDRDLEDGEDDKDVPGFLKPIRVEVRFVTIDYGLWNGRWWLPRLIAFDGVATAGSWIQMPMRYERRYDDYEVTGDTTAPRSARVSPSAGVADSAARAECRALGDVECVCRSGTCRAFEVRLPADTAALVASPLLPPAFPEMGGKATDTLVTAGELEQLTHAVGRLPAAPWQISARAPRWGLVRYNRVEGLALGARGAVDFGRLAAGGSAWVALSDGEPDLEAGLVGETGTARYRLAGYRRLAAVDPAARSLGFGNSLAALLLGRDDGDYYRATGVELTGAPSVTTTQRFGWRVYAERQRRAAKRTDFSLAHTIDGDDVFRPNIIADSADQLGAAIVFHAQRGFDPEAPRWGADVALDGGGGTFGFVRASGAVRLAAPLTPRLAGAVEVAGGVSAGRVPLQSRWYLGGPNTLRGYGGGTQSGDAFWRARVELANRFPAARLVLFTDVGRAGPRDRLSLHQPLLGAGLGASFLDGLLRVDLGRALRSPKGWRLDCYVDGAL
ncbi:MAG TPA: BamA/TamA family outer membrane protein [Gemmatimonadales bacterium]